MFTWPPQVFPHHVFPSLSCLSVRFEYWRPKFYSTKIKPEIYSPWRQGACNVNERGGLIISSPLPSHDVPLHSPVYKIGRGVFYHLGLPIVLRCKQNMNYCLSFRIWKIEAQKWFAPSHRTSNAQTGHSPAQPLLTPGHLHHTTPATHTLGKTVLGKGGDCPWVPSGSGLDFWRNERYRTSSVGAAGHIREADLLSVT